ncbi:phasin family protein [Tateyamaria omphalii]|uniref:phasin family protein n=1 Tax=Tateyamaria omphalii TaxID=299262 RepID=UPI001C993F42|nr:phasin family protein [Tateyamaria omphalii]MBY5931368.1 phasin family protein [Tateyamaria omphalii]
MPKAKPAKLKVSAANAPMAAVNPAAAQAWMDITTECARFAMDRVQQDFAAQRAMMACTSPADLMRLQVEYCQTATKQYADQATRMVELMTAAMGQKNEDGTSPFSRKYDDIPL